MAIRLLSQGVQAVLRSGIIVTSPAQAVVELVLNSLDAGATSVAVRVDLKLFKLQVIDNGSGIELEQLDALGPRYMTSKCHTLDDLHNNLSYYGFRGEALSSLREVSALLVLVSRPQGSNETYCKAFVHGKDQPAAISDTKRPGYGTTVTVQDFMYNMPVRRKRICEAIDLEEIRSHIMSIALMHPQVSFSLRDNSKGTVMFEKHKSTDFLTCFSHIFGQTVADSLAPICCESDRFKIRGFISKEPHRMKQIQFIYVNKRLIVKTKLHRLINALLAKSSILRGNGPWRHKPIPKAVSADRWLAFPSPEKKNKFPVFIIQIECESKEYDVCLDPKKTHIEFEDWKSLLECVEEAIRNFLEREHLVEVQERSTTSSSQGTEYDKEVSIGNKGVVIEEETVNKDKTIQYSRKQCEEIAENNFKTGSVLNNEESVNLPNVIHGIMAKRRSIVHSPKIANSSQNCNEKILNSPGISGNVPVLFRNCAQNSCTNENLDHGANDTYQNTATCNKTVAGPKNNEFSLTNKYKGADTEGNTPPIVKFKNKHQRSSVLNLKITKGAYLFRLEEDRKRNISKILKKYDISEMKSKIKRAGKSKTNYKIDPLKLSEATSHTKHSIPVLVKENCQGDIPVLDNSSNATRKQNIVSAEKDIPLGIVLPSDLSLRERIEESLENVQETINEPVWQYHDKNESTSLLEMSVVTENNVIPCNTNLSLRTANETDDLCFLKNMDVGLSSPKISSYEETLSIDEENFTVSLPGLSSNILSPLSNRNEKNFLTTQDFLCTVDNSVCEKKFLSDIRNKLPSASKELPMFEMPISNITESISCEFSSKLYNKSACLDDVNEEYENSRYLDTHVLDSGLFFPNIITSATPTKPIKTPVSEWNHQTSPYFNTPECKEHLNISNFGTFSRNNSLDRPQYDISGVMRLHKTVHCTSGLQDNDLDFSTFEVLNECEPVLNKGAQSGVSRENIVFGSSSFNKEKNMPLQTELYCLTNSVSDPKLPIKNNPKIVDYLISEESQSSCESLNGNDLVTKSASSDLECEERCTLNPQPSIGNAFLTWKKKKVTFSETLKYITPNSENCYQDLGNKCVPNSSDESQNSETNSLKQRDILRSVKYQIQIKPLSMSEITVISIPPISSPYFPKKTLVHETDSQSMANSLENMDINDNGSESENCSGNCNIEPSNSSSELSSSGEIPLTQLTPPHLQLSGNNILESESLVPRYLPLIEEHDKTDSNSNEMYASPYFSFVSKDSCKDISQSEIEMQIGSVSRKRNVDNDVDSMYGKKSILEIDTCHESSENTSPQHVINNDTVTSQDSFREQDGVLNNLTSSQAIHVPDFNLTKNPEQVNELEEISKIVNKNEEWIQMTNSEGKIFYMNKRSGMTSFNPPATNEPNTFTMSKRYEFIPKGMSPILDDKVPSALRGNVDMSPNSREVLHSMLLNDAVLDDYLSTVKWKDLPDQHFLGCKELVKTLLSNGENQMRYCETEVPNSSKMFVKMSNSIYHYKYDREIFSKLQIIGQWDNKFIMTIVSLASTNAPHVIGVFDQHAVHERIRLEKLMTDYLEEGTDSQFRSSEMEQPIILDLSGKEHRIMSNFKEKFERLGLRFEFLNEFRVRIIKVPTCLHNREMRERSKGAILKNFLELLVQEYVEFLIKTRGSEPQVPNVLREVINYEACRGAVKFGDPLTNEECWALLMNLSKCQLPFYCAHGRPSFVPIFDLKEFKEQKRSDQALAVQQILCSKEL
ncbi:DNA mismatch repair protein Mlh3 [Anabrus simplex]|uniref:DNA mismatch repair protein Mlh3 n=1 Tax=Anabrus simplex TaxID=316456 RepID=UPI0035A3AEE7